MSGKGSRFERDFCRTLSLWYTDGRRNDIFWRAANSGGMGTVRRRMGKQAGQGYHGDIAAVDPSGAAFIDIFTLELKRGYPRASLQDLYDTPEGRRCPWQDWVAQAHNAHLRAGSVAWLLVHRRNNRTSVVVGPRTAGRLLIRGLQAEGIPEPKSFAVLHTPRTPVPVFVMQLDEFFSAFSPALVLSLGR